MPIDANLTLTPFGVDGGLERKNQRGRKRPRWRASIKESDQAKKGGGASGRQRQRLGARDALGETNE